MLPCIGIPLSLDDRGRWQKGRDYLYADTRYASAVRDTGGLALHLPIQDSPDALLERIQGLLLPGGDDFLPPTPYPASIVFSPVPERQLDFDRALLRAALARSLPILGICYGMQLLVLELGGTLLYDIPHERPGAGPHRLPEADGRHALRVAQGSHLGQILGPQPDPVNSLHHQGIAQAGPRLRVCATAPDGVIEAVERSDGPLCLGVQWHPEKLARAHRDALFGAFVRACAGEPAP